DAYVGGPDVLEGCINDVDNVDDYLRSHCTDPAIIKLTDADATYATVIAQIGKHLGQAGKDDVAYLHYSGHGSREGAAPEFAKFDLDKRDQTLVCVDSRVSDSNVDLADKELALLVQDIAKNDAHVAWVLDCCHSGSGTRDLDDSNRAGVRAAAANPYTRPFESYLGGRYAEMVKTGDLVIPQARHMLMAGCDRDETSKEDLDKHCGIFTESLYEVLRETRGDLSYAELFGRARARVAQNIARTARTPQRPQFEAIGGFDGWQGFLGRARKIGRKTYVVSNAGSKWSVDAGAIAGLPASPDSKVALSLALEANPDVAVGTAQVIKVGGTASDVVPDFPADPAQRYLATMTTLPDPPLRLRFSGDADVRAALQKALDDNGLLIAALVGPGDEDDGFALTAGGGVLTLTRRDDGVIAVTIRMDDPARWPGRLNDALAHVAQWRRLLALNNPQPQLDPAKVDFIYAVPGPDGTERLLPAPALTFDVEKGADGTWGTIRGQLRLRNRTGNTLNFAILHFGGNYAVDLLAFDQIGPSDDYMTVPLVWDGAPADKNLNLTLDPGGVAAVEQFKLVLTTEPIEAFKLAMPPLASDRGAGGDRQTGAKVVNDDWFTIDLTARITPRLATVSDAPTQLANGQVKVEGHSSVTANLAMVTSLGASRAAGAEDHFSGALAQAGIVPATVAGLRGESAVALDITDISDAAKLADEPLKVRLDLKLAPGEVVIPLVRDGAYLMPAGDFWQAEDGATEIEISHVPAPLVDQRSLGGALRMYFFKSLGFNPNHLQLASFDGAGRASYAKDGVVSAVKAAKRVLVVVHGIIGDTRGMLEGVHACGIDGQYDCVLAYDYENLKTPIDATARAFKDDLAAVGIGPDDGKQVTILAHSMGGLVSRWMIENEGGSALVDHLVMCGTPNAGSPFGEVGKARKLLLAAMGLAANLGVTMPVAAQIAAVVSASAKLTPTLEQMSPTSEFIKSLNAAAPPGTTNYTILAGNIDDYRPPDQAFWDGLMTRITRSAPLDLLFDHAANDIAVKTHSILLDDVLGDHPAVRANVACHHLNYFCSPAGQAALKAVAWVQ
ncbi:MAG: caspase family protein, partial [Novosphingobium sp.]